MVYHNYADRDDETHPAPNTQGQRDYHHDGDLAYLLVTSFTEGEELSGKVWVIDGGNPQESGLLLTGLSQPVGLCFDQNNSFLYAIDQALNGNGYIYQYEISWDKKRFELSRPVYATIYQGAIVFSCSVDQYGNLFFTTDTDKINMISFDDLWSGFQNRQVTIYDNKSSKVSEPKGLDISEGDEIWYVNHSNTDHVGSLNHASTERSNL